MKKGMYVYCKTKFVGFHWWPDAPLQVAYLRHQHRHEFHVKVTVSVEHNDRDVEFITLKEQLDRYLARSSKGWNNSSSCEMMCGFIAEHLTSEYRYTVVEVEVSEDGENGAIFICQP